MNYYEVAIVGSAQDPLTYESEQKLLIGSFLYVSLRNREVKGVVVKEVDKPLFKTSLIDHQKVEGLFSPSQVALAHFIASYYVCSLGEAFSIFHPFKGEKAIFQPLALHAKVSLSEGQLKAYEEILSHHASLLFGVTGSGKTEIYIKLIEEALERQKRTILLMPEIGLTPQMEKRLEKYFGKRVALWHSKQTKKTKEKILERIRKGEIDIIAGARSSLFLPLDDVGLIIVDEEHDDSYKSASKPRLNARDCALVMGKEIHARVVLGSATPSVTTYHKLPVVPLTHTYHPSSKEIDFVKGDDGLSESIVYAIEKTLLEKKQVLVFVPTRANFKMLRCGVCGYTVKCPYCSVSMSLHKKHKALECHYCHYRSEIPQICPSCEVSHFSEFRIGTQEIASRLQERFPAHTVGRFDRDEVTSESKLRTILEDFNDHNIDILVGTQMLSKGHDYHDIGLAVILGIDFILAIPDYRSRERAMQLVVQIAGRTGRKGGGRVIIQSSYESFFAPYLSRYQNFLEDELEMRKELYPPFMRMATLLVSHTTQEKGEQLAQMVAKHLQTFPSLEVVGYGAAAIEKISNHFRFMVLIRSQSAHAIATALHSLTPSSHIAIDVDPVHIA